MLNTLYELTKGETRGNLEDFRKAYSNGKAVAEKIEAVKIDFSFYDNGQELLIYDGRRIEFSCNYTELYGRKHITDVWGRNGLAFHQNEPK